MQKWIIIGITLLLGACSTQTGENENKAAPAPQRIRPDAYFQAALSGNLQHIAHAVAQGTKLAIRNPQGQTALMLAAFNGHTHLVEWMLANGAGLSATDNSGRTALLFAASGKFPETVQCLIDAGADINTTDSAEHFSALMFAASEGNLQVVKKLLAAGADKSLKDADGQTAYDFALQNNHHKVAKLLK